MKTTFEQPDAKSKTTPVFTYIIDFIENSLTFLLETGSYAAEMLLQSQRPASGEMLKGPPVPSGLRRKPHKP